ncbi:MAG TPA: flagellar hook-basal body complex protein, partial [Blastocatellia bacterium]|nr:flagellar hook-basal body complex protein [Blastocatellia bacterium]
APGGQRVQGYQAVNGVIDPDSPLTSIQVPSGQFAEPVETTQATVRTNLSASMAVGDVFHTPVQVYDSKGVAHTLDLAYTKQNNTDYLVTATLDGVGVQLDSGAGAADNATLTFDANGRLVIPAPPAAPPTLAVLPENVIAPGVSTLNGASLDNININLLRTNPDGTTEGNITNFDAASSVTSTLQNGFASGTLSGVSFSPDSSGTLLAVFNNGQTRALGQVSIATFNSQEGLRRLGDNLFGETISSGPPSVGIAGTGGRGGIIGGVLENSNVDISTEFTELIIAQRGFQANSRVINTINQTLQELLQII